jgi:hypothetical protein
MKLWIVGKWYETSSNPEIQDWEFSGVFDDEQKAIDQCKDKSYFIGPVELNQILPEEPTIWPGCYYPLYKEEK